MRIAAFLICLAIAIPLFAGDPPPGSIAVEPEPPNSKHPDPPKGYSWYFWFKTLPGGTWEMWQCLRPDKPPSPPKHPDRKAPTKCEIECAIKFIDEHDDDIKDAVKHDLQRSVTDKAIGDAIYALGHVVPTSEADWPAAVADADAYTDPHDNTIHIRIASLQNLDASQSQFAQLLSHEALHYIDNNSLDLGPTTFPSDPAGDEGDAIDDEGKRAEELREVKFVKKYIADHFSKCDCDKG
jgi:hypothetical protein